MPKANLRSTPGSEAEGSWSLLSAPGVWCFWLLWAALFISLLSLIAPGLTLDAQEVEIIQRHFALGYQVRNPPLYDWLLWLAQELLGNGVLPCLLVRYGLIAATGTLFYYAVLRAAPNPK